MNRLFKLITLTVLIVGHWNANATMEISGVKIEEYTNIGNSKLLLNGAGIRYKTIFKVYVGQLYATRKVTSLEDLIAAQGPKRMCMTFLREIESGPFGKLLTRGVEDNVPKNEISKLIPGLIRMGDLFASRKAMLPGDVLCNDWIPDTGMVVLINGKQLGEPFKEVDFYRAIMSIWLGPVPADFKLKESLLGQK